MKKQQQPKRLVPGGIYEARVRDLPEIGRILARYEGQDEEGPFFTVIACEGPDNYVSMEYTRKGLKMSRPIRPLEPEELTRYVHWHKYEDFDRLLKGETSP